VFNIHNDTGLLIFFTGWLNLWPKLVYPSWPKLAQFIIPLTLDIVGNIMVLFCRSTQQNNTIILPFADYYAIILSVGGDGDAAGTDGETYCLEG